MFILYFNKFQHEGVVVWPIPVQTLKEAILPVHADAVYTVSYNKMFKIEETRHIMI